MFGGRWLYLYLISERLESRISYTSGQFILICLKGSRRCLIYLGSQYTKWGTVPSDRYYLRYKYPLGLEYEELLNTEGRFRARICSRSYDRQASQSLAAPPVYLPCNFVMTLHGTNANNSRCSQTCLLLALIFMHTCLISYCTHCLWPKAFSGLRCTLRFQTEQVRNADTGPKNSPDLNHKTQRSLGQEDSITYQGNLHIDELFRLTLFPTMCYLLTPLPVFPLFTCC